MPSPRIATTTGGVTSPIRAAYTTPLLAAIQQGTIIQASHLNLLTDFINVVATHTHTLQEYTSLFETGNINGGTILNTRTTSTPSGAVTIGSYVAAAGSTITATHHNTLSTAANSAKTHNHTFSDDVP
jgi:hypothetical protein